MIGIQEQEALFIKIARALPKKITAYAIGGTAMMLHALKTVTLDIDLVFLNEDDRTMMKQTVDALNYKEFDATKVYGTRPEAPIMVTIEDARLDLFSRNVLGVRFSDSMIQRATDTHQFVDTLIIHPADIHDIMIMKSVTQRAKDEEDVVALLKSGKIHWPFIIAEVENQVSLGNERANLSLGHLLERLQNKGKFPIPQDVLDTLWRLLKRQTRTKQKTRKSKV